MGFFGKLGKDVKELVGFNSGEDDDIDEIEEQETSKAVTKRQKMEDEVDEFR